MARRAWRKPRWWLCDAMEKGYSTRAEDGGCSAPACRFLMDCNACLCGRLTAEGRLRWLRGLRWRPHRCRGSLTKFWRHQLSSGVMSANSRFIPRCATEGGGGAGEQGGRKVNSDALAATSAVVPCVRRAGTSLCTRLYTSYTIHRSLKPGP